MTRRSKLPNFSRRRITAGLAATAAAPFVLRGAPAAAQAGGIAMAPAEPWSELGRMAREAERFGISVPRMSVGPESMTSDYDRTMPAVVDFIDSLDASPTEPGSAAAEAAGRLREQAGELLGRIQSEEKLPREPREWEPVPGVAARKAPPKFEDVAEDYKKLFATCVIRDAKRNEIQWYVTKILDEKRRGTYVDVYDRVCVPWYFIAVIHGMECGFDLQKHLHNGDPLRSRTVQIPANRPAVWNPPTDWVSSAVDALTYDKFADQKDWQLARMLYRWEAYNGWRSRMEHGINTPYLWSFSNHYTKGKFVADNVWSADAVSKQCGAAVMMKALIETGAISPPA